MLVLNISVVKHLFSTPNPCGHGMKPAGLSGSLCLAVKVYGRCSPNNIIA